MVEKKEVKLWEREVRWCEANKQKCEGEIIS
jgi:hypothetical protein